jgi:hypothetical protein
LSRYFLRQKKENIVPNREQILWIILSASGSAFPARRALQLCREQSHTERIGWKKTGSAMAEPVGVQRAFATPRRFEG